MPIYLLDNMNICTGPVDVPVIPGLGPQLPSNAIELDEILPLPARGNVWIWKNGCLVEIADQRGVAYDIDTGKEEPWTELGELPEHLTFVPRPGTHYVWTDQVWKLDEEAEQAALVARTLGVRDGLLYEAGLRIAPLQDAVDLNRATDEEEAALLQWKGYRIELNRIEDQGGFPSDIQWPAPPETRHAR